LKDRYHTILADKKQYQLYQKEKSFCFQPIANTLNISPFGWRQLPD